MQAWDVCSCSLCAPIDVPLLWRMLSPSDPVLYHAFPLRDHSGEGWTGVNRFMKPSCIMVELLVDCRFLISLEDIGSTPDPSPLADGHTTIAPPLAMT